MKRSLPFGTWPSPITADMVGGKSPQVSEPLVTDSALFYLQSLPEEKNRCTIMRYEDGQSQSLLARPINVRSKVHEYGGGAYTVGENTLYFVVADDQRIYRINLLAPECKPEAITSESGGRIRFADLEYDQHRKRLLAICEDHTHEELEAQTSLVAISLKEDIFGQIDTLASGSDFYSNPRLAPDGNTLCWITWMHPNMPWDATTLVVAALDDQGTVKSTLHIGDGRESLCQPRWSPDGELFVISDRSEWWNIYHCLFLEDVDFQQAGIKKAQIKFRFTSFRPAIHGLKALERCEPELNLSFLNNINPDLEPLITPIKAEFATPQWTFNMSTYAFLNANEILATYTQNGEWKLCKFKKQNHEWILEDSIDADNSVFSGLSAKNNCALYVRANGTESNHVCVYKNEVLLPVSTHSTDLNIDNIARAQALRIPTSNNEHTHAFYYSPTNADFEDKDNLPPAIVICHGGPTGATDTALNLKIQFWTSRGFAVCDVNYRGSTGYGKAFRQRLYKSWGDIDVDDLCAAANYMVEKKLADKNKLIVKGSSAGGYSVLAALATRKVFKAGVSLYGIGDLEILARDTHKFEARYLDNLIGPYPQEIELYRSRSPIYSTEQFNCPVLVFQGLEDKVVPPNQAELIVEAVKNKGLPVAYRTFADEGHGFRNLDNIQTMLNDELYFYCKVFSLPIPESCVSTLHIHNLD